MNIVRKEKKIKNKKKIIRNINHTISKTKGIRLCMAYKIAIREINAIFVSKW